MSYNNSRNYNTRNSGRYNRPGSFVPASSSNHQTYYLSPAGAPAAQPLPPPPAAPVMPALSPPSQGQPENTFKQDVEMRHSEEKPAKREPFFKTRLSGIKKIPNKERRRRQNALLRRLTTPKNALMCINEMLPNEQINNQFKVEAAPTDSLYYNSGAHSFCAELALDGVTYKGYGENKLAARNAAAEQAIRDIVLRKMARHSDQALASAGGGGGGAMAALDAALDAEAGGGEALPMIQLLSFALHKLFAEWEGAGHHVPQFRPRPPAPVSLEEEGAAGAAGGAAGAARKVRKVPDNAAAMHPAMLLTILRPHAAYRELHVVGDKPQNMVFTMAIDVDDKTYTGRAPNKKEARKEAARAACKAILGITFDDEAGGSHP